jgi:uncharacterized membrane protein
MWSFSWGVIALAAVSLVIFFGLAQRVLDRMGLTNWQAIGVIVAMLVGSFIDIPVWRGDIEVTLNLGGAIIPLILSIYLLIKAGSAKEKWRAIIAAVGTGIATSVIGGVLMTGEVSDQLAMLDPIYIYPLIAGLVAYILGRSRRASFVAAVLGVMGMDMVHWVWLYRNNVPGTVYLGGGGAFDSIVIAGIFAVVLAEVIGEVRERLQGGPKAEGHDPALLAKLREVGPGKPGNLESLGEQKEEGQIEQNGSAKRQRDKNQSDNNQSDKSQPVWRQPMLNAEMSKELSEKDEKEKAKHNPGNIKENRNRKEQ